MQAVRLWDIASGTELRPLRGHTDTVQRVVFSADGRTAYMGRVDGGIWIWPVARKYAALRRGSGSTLRADCIGDRIWLWTRIPLTVHQRLARH